MIRNKTKFLIIITITIMLLFLIKCSSCCFAYTFVIDPGHGAEDPGAIQSGIYEKDLNLKVAKYLRDYLKEYEDVEVILTHEGQLSKNMSIEERGMCALNNKADLLISLHFNSSTVASINRK